MAELVVALLQVAPPGDDPGTNLPAGEAACRRAAEMGADVALFPEMWSTGYSFPQRPGRGDLWRADAGDAAAIERLLARATPVDGPFVAHFRDLAARLEMAIVITFLEAAAEGARNTACLVDRRGEIALTYAKVHTCAFDLPEGALVAGDGFPVARLETRSGPVEAGLMICYDREFPESARVLMLNGAEVILTPNACDLDGWRLAQFSTRAIENAVAVAMANYPRPKNNGHSCAYHPMLFPPGGGEARDNLVVMAGEAEEIVLARFDLDGLREYRQRETFGNAFRRPAAYTAITWERVRAPFRRVGPGGRPYSQRGGPPQLD
jgi:N-carbamoylputrescine amidase